MTVLIKAVTIVDPQSSYNGQIVDLLVENGRIARIGQITGMEADSTIRQPGLHASPGWVDVFCQFHDPGYEHKETLATGAAAAAAGGFTDVFVVPNTNPSVQNKSQVEYITSQSAHLPAAIHPIAAVSKNLEGKDLGEMYDMHASGAKAFSDGLKPIQSAGVLLKALQYVKTIDGTVIQVPDDVTIGAHGLMHEGITSTRMGMQSKPILAEELMVSRDLQLLSYTHSRLHITGVTSPVSLAAIQQAKTHNLQVTCSVTPHHLLFCDEDLEGYDANLKVFPPLRNREQMMALRNAVIHGQVDVITSHHLPQDWDSKTCEFEYAKPGMVGLESCFGVIWSLLGNDITIEQWVRMIATTPRSIFHLDPATITEGHIANITLFNPSTTYTFTKDLIRSKSVNTPILGKELKGKVVGTIHGHHTTLA